MRTAKKEVIGVIGGCGPHAGIMLAENIFRQTLAGSDQEHLPMLLSSMPDQIPDRTAFILGDADENPACAIASIILQMEAQGVTVAGIACNTSHAPIIYHTIQGILHAARSEVKLLHMIEETMYFLEEHFRQAKRIGVLATDGTYKTGLYEYALQQHGFNYIKPPADFQHKYIHQCIYDKKYGIKCQSAPVTPQAMEMMEKAVQYYRDKGAEALVLGCTEFSLALSRSSVFDIPVIDSTKVMARALIREAAPHKLCQLNYHQLTV
ncbi:aspartate/glutamate racemase family protein [Chitinophaga eiseniae]|uniref:Aspartate/glutamate racemase family protein n=1 Tax=Chitinophaga eiseniae TaxID=634771 RepID=A0A847SC53_9BACT|nr:amino acid racemase [Chitinophaga eiseniae]NLR77744.1 aspartate/glutamate racemase family protein [Chitinophaga eiseniae]